MHKINENLIQKYNYAVFTFTFTDRVIKQQSAIYLDYSLSEL